MPLEVMILTILLAIAVAHYHWWFEFGKLGKVFRKELRDRKKCRGEGRMKMSKRLGVYSGRIYEAEDDYSRECCKVITEEQADDENWLADQRLINRFKCIDCSGCPMSNGNNGGKYEDPSYR